ncbi:MAG: M6 family metalloprotease domain-containing protein [Chloroflexi bacterium]|nr:M6 family metalloprotease domain-containing protein [Chloroflexota bacterium]
MTRSFLLPMLRWLTILALGLAIVPATDTPPAVSIPNGSHPMPPPPRLVAKLRQDGWPLPEIAQTRQEQGIGQPSLFPTPPSGAFNLLAVCVQFTDKPASVAPTAFDGLMFNPPGSGSVTDYYDQISYGSFTLVTLNLPGTLGWQTAARPYNGSTGYVNNNYGWGAYPQNLQGLVADVLPLIDPLVDFSHYDNNKDGFVDSIVFIHAGPGAEITSNPNDVWSDAWNMSDGNGPGPLQTGDGVSVDNFIFGPEYMVVPGDQTIGVYCHELGHTLFGLPDLYDRDYTSYGLGHWSLMAMGGWNGPLIWVPWLGYAIPNGASPAWPDAWCRTVMGFDQPMPTDGDLPTFPFPPVSVGRGWVFKLWSPQLGPHEYFLVENRQQVGFDAFLPGNGLLIWHVDEAKWNPWAFNDYECTLSPGCQCPTSHPLIALEQADGLLDLENKTNAGDAGDPFPGTSGNTTWQFNTNPDSASWYASPCPTNGCVAMNNIVFLPGPPPFHIMADLHVVCQAPGACVNMVPVKQAGWAQPGASTSYHVSLQNCSSVADVLAVSVSGSWPCAIVDRGSGLPITQTGTVGPGGAWYVNVIVTAPVTASVSIGTTILQASSTNNPAVQVINLITTAVPRCVLLVDDDHGTGMEGPYVAALTTANMAFDHWDVTGRGSPGLADLSVHPVVIWFTGAPPGVPLVDTLNPREEIDLGLYLNQGGQLFFCSRDYLWDIGRSAFSRDYLRVATFTDDTGTTTVQGVSGNPVGESCGTYTLNPPATRSDQINPHPPAAGAFVDAGGLSNALTYDSGTWRVLFLAWPFEYLAPPDAATVMAAALRWFGILPQVSFTPSTTIVHTRETITFTSTAANVTWYHWDFGDGTTSTLPNPMHVYTVPITATVTLRGSNPCSYAQDTQMIRVIDYTLYLPLVMRN